MASLIDEFNEAVKHFDAQTDEDWQHKAVKSLCKKFTLLAKAADTEEEVTELVHGMNDFFQKFVGLKYDGDPGYEEIDATTNDIELLGHTMFTVAKRGMLPEGSSKAMTLLAAKVVGYAEDADEGDSFDAWQAQSDKVAEIAESMKILEAVPVQAPSPSAAFTPPDAPNTAGPKKTLTL